jgi:hypothetical protein
MWKRIRLLAACALGAAMTACAGSRPVKIPMEVIIDRAPATAGPKALLVLMPGIRDTPQDIVRHGFIAAVRKRGIAADVVIADAHIGYFRAGTFFERLHADVIEPAQGRAYSAIWIAGISLGGFGALAYASQRSEDIAGVIAIAPYVARPSVVDEVLEAGGLGKWQPPELVEADDYERRLLTWLKGYDENTVRRPPLFIGYGSSDRLAEIDGAIAALLPAERLVVVNGGHSWRPWTAIWEAMLDRVPLPRIQR